MAERVIFHVDANSAFLSWSAVYKVKVLGETEDLREVPSVVAGDKESRHSIILAKSTPAKKFGIQTGEPLFQALENVRSCGSCSRIIPCMWKPAGTLWKCCGSLAPVCSNIPLMKHGWI